jgi:DNA-binding CsgD family transcriptional regulator
MTIRQEIFGNIRTTIAGHGKRASAFSLPPLAIADIGNPRSTRRPELTPGPAWARAAAAALGVIGLPAAVLSRTHRLAAANGLMERLIPRVVQDRQQRLGLADRRADSMLGQALLQMQTGVEARVIPLAATAHLPPSVVHVFPALDTVQDAVQDTVQDIADAEAVSCIIVITAVSRPRIASAEVLRDLFDLTPAEARVACGIAAGKTVHDLAAEAGLAAGTVRQQLKSVFGKTGVSRQADLVALVVGSALSFPGTMPAGKLA